MKKLIIIIIAFVLIACVSYSACAAGIAMIRSLPEVEGDFGKVVIMRPKTANEPRKSARAYNVYLNYFIVDKINRGTYTEYKLPPGTYRLYAGNDIVSRTIQFDVKKGDEKFFETKMQSFGDDYPVIELNEIQLDNAKRQTRAMKKDRIRYNDPRQYPSLPINSGQAS